MIRLASLTALASLSLLALLNLGCAKPANDWNVLFITFDTTRADALGCYGNEDSQTPTLDALAAEGFLFEQAFATAPITLPSHSSMFTGTYPLAHGVRDNGTFKLPSARITLAEVLSERGFVTGAAIGAFPLTREFGLDQGFDFYDDRISAGRQDFQGQLTAEPDGLYFDERPAPHVNDAIVPFLRSNAGGRFFAWIHYWDPHQPLIPVAPYNQTFAHNLYLGEISQADHSLGRVLDELRRQGVLDRTLIVMTADHGEGHGEHREDSHSLLAYNATLHVPLIVRIPGQQGGKRIQEKVSSVDIMPTILDLLSIPWPEGLQGESLVPLIKSGEPSSRARPLYAETLSPRLSHGWGEIRALFYRDHKYIHGPRPELYDLAADPNELADLTVEDPETAAEMKLLLEAFIRRYASAESSESVNEIDSTTRQRLAALGYLSVTGSETGVNEGLREDGIPPQDRIQDISLSSRTKQALDRKQFLLAREMATELVGRDTANGYYRGLLALSYFGLGQLDQAAQVAEQADTLISQNDSVFLVVAKRLFIAGERERAMTLTKKLVRSHATAYGHYLLAEMHYATGNDALRVEELEQALELEPGFDLALLSLAIHHGEAGNGQRAEELLRTLLSYHPFHAKALFNLAVLALQRQDHDEAELLLDRSIEIESEYWQAHVALLALRVELGESNTAQEKFEWIMKHCPDQRHRNHAKALIGSS